MPDIPTWTIAITGKDADAQRRMVLQAVLADLPGWDVGKEMRTYLESVRDDLQRGGLSFTGDRLEIEAVLSAVNVTFALFVATDGFRRLSGVEQEKARKQAAYAHKWVCEAAKVIDDAPQGHGVRMAAKSEPAKTTKRAKVVAKSMSLFGDEV